jgi:hypothetical protein
MGRAARLLAPTVLTLAYGCHSVSTEDAQDVAALRLTCAPVTQGLRCQLLALSRVVARAPRDVTADAIWRVDGPPGTAISKAGIVHGTQVGATGLLAEFQSQRAFVEAWLTPNAPGELLGTLRGHVYGEVKGALQPLSRVRVEVLAGRNVGRWTTTAPDGSYALSRLRAGKGRLGVRGEPRYLTTEEILEILPGDNQENLLMSPSASPIGASPARRLVATLRSVVRKRPSVVWLRSQPYQRGCRASKDLERLEVPAREDFEHLHRGEDETAFGDDRATAKSMRADLQGDFRGDFLQFTDLREGGLVSQVEQDIEPIDRRPDAGELAEVLLNLGERDFPEAAGGDEGRRDVDRVSNGHVARLTSLSIRRSVSIAEAIRPLTRA